MTVKNNVYSLFFNEVKQVGPLSLRTYLLLETSFKAIFVKIARTLDLQTDELGRMLIYAFGSWMFDGSWTSVRDVDFIWTACRTSSACFVVFSGNALDFCIFYKTCRVG